MNASDYSTTLLLQCSPEQAYTAINHVPGWWTRIFEGHSAKAGDVFTVRFGETFITIEVTELVPDKKILWKVIDCHKHWLKNKKEWMGTMISFDISEQDGMTQLAFTHHGLVPGLECYGACENAWSQYIRHSLHDLIITGQGSPDKQESK